MPKVTEYQWVDGSDAEDLKPKEVSNELYIERFTIELCSTGPINTVDLIANLSRLSKVLKIDHNHRRILCQKLGRYDTERRI